MISYCTLIKKKIKFSSYIRKFRMEQLQSHIWLTASSYMGKYLRISSYIRKPFLIYDFETAPLWIYEENLISFFISVEGACRALSGLHHTSHPTDSSMGSDAIRNSYLYLHPKHNNSQRRQWRIDARIWRNGHWISRYMYYFSIC